MSSPALKVLPQVNLEEFERRLRAATMPQSGGEDPLAELARLVGLENPPQKNAENVVALTSRASPSEESASGSAHEPLIRVSYASARPAPNDPLQLRPTFAEEAEPMHEAQFHAPPAPASDLGVETSEAADTPQQEQAPVARESRRPPSRGRWFATVSLLSLLGIVGVGTAVTLKYGAVPGLRKAPPVIMASVAPAKVAPPSSDTVAPPNDTASVLFKEQSTKPAVVKVVSTEEQPVDLHTQGVAPAPAPAAAQPTSVAAPTAPAAETSSPVAPNPTTLLIATSASPTVEASVGSPLFAEPKRVKTVSVRPDGTLIAEAPAAPADPAPVTRSIAPIAAPAPPADAPVDSAAAQPATPKLDLPAKPRAKLTARVQPGKIDTSTVAAADAPLQLTPPTKLEKAAKAARAKSAATVTAALPASPAVAEPADPTPAATAPAASPAASAAASSGSYSVQLAAPGSDQEAQSVATRLKAKYSFELNGLEPTIHKADVTSGTVYRVRVGSLSKADAVALCEKLKASGGACFVAKSN
jgi:SPOR domain